MRGSSREVKSLPVLVDSMPVYAGADQGPALPVPIRDKPVFTLPRQFHVIPCLGRSKWCCSIALLYQSSRFPAVADLFDSLPRQIIDWIQCFLERFEKLPGLVIFPVCDTADEFRCELVNSVSWEVVADIYRADIEQ